MEIFDFSLDKACSNFNYFSNLILEKNPRANIDLIKKAYDLSKSKHNKVKRESGEPYFIHPVATALILLTNYISETNVICAALLHDVCEDTDTECEVIEEEFNKDVFELVKNLTKLDKKQFSSYQEYKSENIRKLIIASSKDVRVMFIKLADRLHNMSTLNAKKSDRQKRIATETLNIYSPLAEKLGLYNIKSNLEDLSFLYLKPKVYRFISNEINLTKKEREEKTNEIVDFITRVLKKEKITFEIYGRAKHFYSIYKKIINDNKSINQIYDLYGIRIIVNEEYDCYTIKNILDTFWPIEIDKKTKKPRIKDFIKNPKPNGYQSLHINYNFNNTIIEVQIRTKEMHEKAESGVAKHWKYKANERDKKLDKRIDFIRQALLWKLNPKQSKAAESYMIDLFGGDIVCITPKGDPIILKEGSTVLDFAYAIHSKVGDHFEKATVNGETALINRKLSSGDVVNIITSQKPKATKQWFSHIITNEAKQKLRQTLKIEGKKKSPKKISKSDQSKIEEFQLTKKIGFIGKTYPVKLSKCCHPSFGDSIVGYLTKDKKVSIHKISCPDRFALNPKSQIEVKWIKEKKPVITLVVLAKDYPGVLSMILDILIKKNVDVIKVSSDDSKKNFFMTFVIKKNNTKGIKEAIEQIKNNEAILDINIDL